ncbi:hypothetical protein C0991_001156 [Blastosporella zonata]|nr:hypothetical protein C0991_001156 [Blastosporella zonata]
MVDDQPAIGAMGQLPEPKDMEWFHDADNEFPMNPGLSMAVEPARLDPSIDNSNISDNESLFQTSSSLSESEDDEEDAFISKVELASSLLAKLIPTTGRHSQKHKHNHVVTLEDVEDIDSARHLQARSNPPSSTSIIELYDPETSPQATKKANMGVKRNPIYLFYESVSCGANGKVGGNGDKHYKCYHGNRKVLTVTRGMKCNLAGLVKVLKEASSAAHTFYLLLKDQIEDNKPITEDDIKIASGQAPIDAKKQQL